MGDRWGCGGDEGPRTAASRRGRGRAGAIALSVVVAAAACACQTASTAPAPATTTAGGTAGPHAHPPLASRSFVLVHGAWMGGWSWAEVADGLARRGAEVTIVELPAHGDDQTPLSAATLDAYVGVVKGAIAHATYPVVLVGHSLGGVVITQAVEPDPGRVERMVYLAGFVPRSGEAVASLAGRDAASQLGPVLKIDDRSGLARIPEAALGAVFCAGCNDDALAQLAANYRDEPAAPLATPVTITDGGWGSVPKYYVYTSRDQAISPALQQQMTAGVPWVETATLETDHAPMLSAPDEVIDVLTHFGARQASR